MTDTTSYRPRGQRSAKCSGSFSGVHSVNSNCATRLGLSQGHSFIFAAVSPSPNLPDCDSEVYLPAWSLFGDGALKTFGFAGRMSLGSGNRPHGSILSPAKLSQLSHCHGAPSPRLPIGVREHRCLTSAKRVDIPALPFKRLIVR